MASPLSSPPSLLNFADLLRYHRVAAGLTQEELAERASLSVDAISTLERGARRRPRKETITLLADALALPAEERATFVAAARRPSAASLVATPPADVMSGPDGGVPALAPASDANMPHGSVTFLFADLEDSTRLLHQLGSVRYADILAQVQALLHVVWATHAGHELGTQGDRFFAVFADTDDALAAALAAQQALTKRSWPEGSPVRLRMGVHSGDALLTAGRYVGLEVHRAMCIAAAGHGGQILMSRAVTDQVAKFGYELPGSARLRSLGKHRLQDLPHREDLYELVQPDVPGQTGIPVTFAPLRTLDAWPGLRADLTAVVCMSAGLLAVVGVLLALVVPAFPWAIGLGAAGLAGAVLLGAAVAQPVRQALRTQWRDARKPVTAVTSTLLALVVVVTTLFLTKPAILARSPHLVYDFTYTYHRPTHTGGAITIGLPYALQTLAPPGLFPLKLLANSFIEGYIGLWQSCLTQLPDTRLGLASYKPDQCTEVPTNANGGESADGLTTTFHIDSRAVWSDGMPVTADDYRFSQKLYADPNINVIGVNVQYLSSMQLTAPDLHTVEIHWPTQYGDYLAALAALVPIPLHVYATGAFAGIFNPQTGAYNSALAQTLFSSPGYTTTIPVDDGPFRVQSYVPLDHAVLVRNPYFYSNFFHAPALDRITLVSAYRDFARQIAQGKVPSNTQLREDMITAYREGGLEEVEGLLPVDLGQLSGVPANEVITSPDEAFIELGFNQRTVAPNACANGGMSMFTDRAVRQAFVEAFDRCGAVRALLGISTCADPNLFTDELTAPPAPDYDPTFKLPAYNPIDAAKLLDHAGYPVVGGVRRAKDGKTPLQLTLVVSQGGSDFPALATRMQQDYLNNLHISVIITANVNLFDPGNPTQTGTFDLLLLGQNNSPDPVGSLVYQGGGWVHADGWLGLTDPYVIAQDQFGSELIDSDQRATEYQKLQRYVSGLLDIEPVYLTSDVTLTKPTLCNFKKWPEFGFNLWNMADWYVASACPS